MAARAQKPKDSRQPLGSTTTISPWVRVCHPLKSYQPETDEVTGGDNVEAFVSEINNRGPVAQAAIDGPALIILLPWLGAGPRQVEKYIQAYQSLYPMAEVLLISTSMRHLLWRPGSETPVLKPAVPFIRNAASPTPSQEPDASAVPKILVHAFSNAGSAMLARLRETYSEDGRPFPPHVAILDSCPGLYHFTRCLLGATAGLPRWLWYATLPGSVLFVVSYAVWYVGRKDGFQYWFEQHNEVGGEVGRVYIYSEADEVIAAAHIEKHARKAKALGYSVRLEEFDGSAHVAHMRRDGTRYWRVVREAWEEGRGKRVSAKL